MAGHQISTSSADLGTSGKPKRVFSLTLQSKVGGAGRLILHNGTAGTDPETARVDGVSDAQVVVNYGNQGKFFPAGCYLELDSNVQYVDVDYEQVQS